MLERVDETIVATSSPPGHGPVGIVRLSGPLAGRLVASVLEPAVAARLESLPGWTRLAGEIVLEPGLRVPASVYQFRAPRSYTGQDLVEVHTVGSPVVLGMLMRRLVACGARPAEPGEFTARAFLAGRMDLSAAEAVGAVIRARTDQQLRAARRLRAGILQQQGLAVSEALAELLALVEADIDFAEEPIEFIAPSQLGSRLSAIGEQLDTLLARSVSLERLEALPRILLLGPPNAGKSTMMNALSGTPRAICAPVAGTTRDVLSAPITLEQGEALLLDAAGVDASDDPIVAQARAMTLAAAEHADLVCLVVDLSEPVDAVPAWVEALDARSFVIVANKADRVAAGGLEGRLERLRGWRLGPVVASVATAGAGLDELRGVLGKAVGEGVGTAGEEAAVLSERQRTALVEARAALGRAMNLAASARATIDCADLLAFELREAMEALGSIGGAVTTEELLGRVFANFCIGK